ncbi:MAG: hypothetical protein FJZ96_11625 [Chloroflexi bacterium]|nr:hypothetical protein [Chloroflexota bacterium]
MTGELDLNLLPFYRLGGQEWPTLPGLTALNPPKKCARGREDDRLILYLAISGNIPFSSTDYNRLTGQLVERFYQTPGSLTSAMRRVAESFNQSLVSLNLRSTGRGQHTVGRLILGSLRGAQLVLVQCGPTHVFHIGAQARHFHDAQISGRGLGASQTTPVFFSQTDLEPGDLLALCPHLPAGWEAALQAERSGASLEALRRKLLASNQDDLNAAIIQAQAGNGNISFLKALPPQPAPDRRADLPPVSAPAAQGQAEERPVSPARRMAQILSQSAAGSEGVQRTPPPAVAGGEPEGLVPAAAVQRAPARPAEQAEEKAQRPASRFIRQSQAGDSQPAQPAVPPRRRQVFGWLARALRAVRHMGQVASAGVKRFLPRMLPGEDEPSPPLTRPFLAVTAIAIPLVVATVAVLVYMRYGTPAQYEENYQLAVNSAVGAIGQDDPAVVRHAWESAIYYLDKAESYKVTTESQELRVEAQNALDTMDGIIRLNFRAAISPALNKTVQVSRMAASETDLYLLNATAGNVLRAFETAGGYEVDPSFECGPGTFGDVQVGALIDIATLPAYNQFGATLLAMDGSGALLYCAPGEEPQAARLAAPDISFKGIAGFTLDTDANNLYILDPAANAVWVYAGYQGSYADLPIFFFGEQIPAEMSSAIELAATRDDLYLLFASGQVTICTVSRLDEVPTRCYDPATLVDNRPGHQSGPTITDALFTQMTFASPPDPSLYLLVPNTQAVYRFSPRPDSLNLQAQLRATVNQSRELSGLQASAMAISPSRYLFLSIGNQVYYATDVP